MNDGGTEINTNRSDIRWVIWFNRLASEAEKERQEDGSNYWVKVSEKITKMVTEQPEKAFDFGVKLILSPTKHYEEAEWRRRYIRGVGLTILTEDSLIDEVKKYLVNSPRKEELNTVMSGFINLQNVEKWDKDQALSTPEFFNMVQAIALGYKIGGELKDTASKKLSDPRIWEMITWYKDIEDTSKLFTELEKFKNG